MPRREFFCRISRNRLAERSQFRMNAGRVRVVIEIGRAWRRRAEFFPENGAERVILEGLKMCVAENREPHGC